MKPIDSLSPGRKSQPVQRLDAATKAESATVSRSAVKVGVASDIAKAEGAPIDGARVAEIRNALRENRYPLVPARIADAMIAAKYMLVEEV